MSDVSLISPTVGLTSIAWSDETVEARDSQQHDYTPIGGRVVQSVRSLYDQATLLDVARDLTEFARVDTDLRQPQRFEAALLDAFDKVAAAVNANQQEGAAALKVLEGIKDAWEQCRYNMAALNQA